jgi:energy-coupling factor transporter ATP-binding protein EcfA2
MSNRIFITKISVRALFGQLSYDLLLEGQGEDPANQVSIFYGDNGSGKTTILKLLYHLLSPIDSKGHKSFLVSTPFNFFSVLFNNGKSIVAHRHHGAITGTLTLELRQNDKLEQTLPLKVEEDGGVRMNAYPQLQKQIFDFLHALELLDVELFFLRDNRFFSSSFDDSSAEIDSGRNRTAAQLEMRYKMQILEQNVGTEQHMQNGALEEAIRNVEMYFRGLTLQGSSRGEGDVNNIYATVIKQLIQTQGQIEKPQANEISNYVGKLGELAEKSKSYVELGLTTPLLFKELSASLATVESRYEEPIINLLKPYIEGVEARLSALSDAKETIATFLASLNTYLVNKRVIFQIETGLTIVRSDGEELAPSCLSSGERQLLFIFCRIMGPKPRSSIFIIDEPEISLNVKWQRSLIANLLQCTKRAPMQFLFASHSIELLTQYRQRVTTLQNIETVK